MEDSLLLEFIKSIQGFIPDSGVRATPKGLFLPHNSVTAVINAYHSWLAQKGLPSSTELKSRKRLFGEEVPPTLILKEGKLTLTGTLLVCKIEQPQQLGIPYFLGSLDDAKSIITDNDPLLQRLSDVVVQQLPAGIRLEVKIKDKTIIVTPPIFDNFTKLRGRELSKVEQVNLLVKTLRNSRKHKEGSSILVPYMIRGNKTVIILTNQSLVFIVNARYEISQVYDTHPRNIEYFLRNDYEDILKRNSQIIGALMVPYKNDAKSVGKIKSRGKDIQISWKGFASLAAKIAEHPPYEPQFQGRFTLIQCLEKLLQQFKGSHYHGSHQRISS